MSRRDAGLVRLRRLTGVAVAGAAALTGIFAGVAAKGVPGRKHVDRAQVLRAPVAAPRMRRQRVPAHPASTAPAAPAATAVAPQPLPPPPAPPPQPPVATPAPPVAVSGGS